MKNAPTTKSHESAKEQANYNIVVAGTDMPRVDSRLIAGQLGIRHKNVISNIEKYKQHFIVFGIVPFKTEKLTLGRGRSDRYALLNEDQAYFLLSLSRNTDRVVDLKVRLVQAFRDARQAVDLNKTEYLPSYRALHDRIQTLAGQTAKSKYVHININKLVNKVAGVSPGERSKLPVPRKALVIMAQHLATQAMAQAKNHNEGYQKAKAVLNGFADFSWLEG
ncbi:Rha family transcriptional regulator [Advenella sp. RU8]|uniref:Rha family transcriptional regulator n=1 Tax=Advenella sp. RU8 TaxID=3399575 RepID=UPI003AAB6F3A